MDPRPDYTARSDDDNPLTVGQVLRDKYWSHYNLTNGDYGLTQVHIGCSWRRIPVVQVGSYQASS